MIFQFSHLSCVRLFATPWTTAHQAFLSFNISWSLLKLMSIELVMPSNRLKLCCPLLLPSIFPSIRVFFKESALRIRWPKYWSFSISPSNECSELISFRIDWFDLLQSKGLSRVFSNSMVQKHQFFSAQPSSWSNSHIHTCLLEKNITLTTQTFISKVISLLFSMLLRSVIAFLPRSKYLLISWLQSPSALILEPEKIKSATVSTVSPSICHEVMGVDAMILVFWMLSFYPTFSLSSLTFIKRLFSSSSLSAIRVVSSAYLRLLIFLPAILIPACVSSSLVFHMMNSAC